MFTRILCLGVLAAICGCNNTTADTHESSVSELGDPSKTPAKSTEPDSPRSPSNRGIQKGGVAIVDLDDVLKQLQLKQAFEATVLQRREQSREQLSSLLIKLRDQYEAKKKAYGDQPSETQAKELQVIYDEINRTYAEARTKADAALAGFQANYIQDFRNKVAPLARRIALDRGLSIVITKNPTNILWFDPELDLTDQVVEALRDQRDR
ncbi:MAG: OmpH family outer membrane protein [Planctomycetota bacterium]|nr:OmpH family outer membrane protein [Planctomycetota bacterium]